MKSKDKARDKYLQRTYGISLTQYNELLKKQGNCCGVCGKPKSEEKRNLAVDHDHKTGEVRGILCMMCNHRVIGRHRDPVLFEKAAKYLNNHTGWFVPPKLKKKRRIARS